MPVLLGNLILGNSQPKWFTCPWFQIMAQIHSVFSLTNDMGRHLNHSSLWHPCSCFQTWQAIHTLLSGQAMLPYCIETVHLISDPGTTSTHKYLTTVYFSFLVQMKSEVAMLGVLWQHYSRSSRSNLLHCNAESSMGSVSNTKTFNHDICVLTFSLVHTQELGNSGNYQYKFQLVCKNAHQKADRVMYILVVLFSMCRWAHHFHKKSSHCEVLHLSLIPQYHLLRKTYF
jgi:hypothetical protein